MHVKLTYFPGGTIDVDISAQNLTGDKVSRILDLLRKRGDLNVERVYSSGQPLQATELLKRKI